uniref:Uncharacterized protein n=1 Tax=Siphoviridae sp. ctj6w2 TaxID=2827919 RepID=A0A8S5T8J8_9CAUD|nr:MAG TPA: hypothetical protein [Siphoviridae sp. ctj6w2]
MKFGFIILFLKNRSVVFKADLTAKNSVVKST